MNYKLSPIERSLVAAAPITGEIFTTEQLIERIEYIDRDPKHFYLPMGRLVQFGYLEPTDDLKFSRTNKKLN